MTPGPAFPGDRKIAPHSSAIPRVRWVAECRPIMWRSMSSGPLTTCSPTSAKPKTARIPSRAESTLRRRFLGPAPGLGTAPQHRRLASDRRSTPSKGPILPSGRPPIRRRPSPVPKIRRHRPSRRGHPRDSPGVVTVDRTVLLSPKKETTEDIQNSVVWTRSTSRIWTSNGLHGAQAAGWLSIYSLRNAHRHGRWATSRRESEGGGALHFSATDHFQRWQLRLAGHLVDHPVARGRRCHPARLVARASTGNSRWEPSPRGRAGRPRLWTDPALAMGRHTYGLITRSSP